MANDIAVLQMDTPSKATPAVLDVSGRTDLVGTGALAVGARGSGQSPRAQ